MWLLASTISGPFEDVFTQEVSYSEFKQQVRTGNVEKVVFKGDQIQGEFVNTVKVMKNEGEERTSRSFSTTLPSVGDDALMPSLEEQDVTIHAETQENSWWSLLLISWLPWILIFGLILYAQKKVQDRMGGQILGFGQSPGKRFEQSESKVKFHDVAGLENPKKDLQEIIDYLKDPSRFQSIGAELPKGVLLLGPPGTGKTLLAKASAGEADVPFFSLSGSEFIEMFVGVGASRVRNLFANAKKESPAIIFIDEIDSIGRARGTGLGGGHDEREQTLNQILSEMDGFDAHDAVVVMAATNRPDVLDTALTRPGRFDRHVTIDLPDKRARTEILLIHTRNIPLHEDVNLEHVARRTVGLSGADLKNLANEAALFSARKHKEKVENEDFDQALDKILLGAVREDIITDDEKRIVAYHESGHALVAKLMPHADPLRKVSIIPRGRSLGATEQIPAEDRHNLGYRYLRDRLAILLGGRVAEKLIFNEYTTGAANDLKEATKLAKRMVCQWGMSERLGPLTYRLGEEHVFLGKEIAQDKDYSEHTAQIIDEETQSLVVNIEANVEELLAQNKTSLDALAGALLEQETLENHVVDNLLKIITAPAAV
ncbi:MAG: ATP-dependent zinc metalloprotease FtsH [Nitrospirales bacterium]|nr:MAG: ATP-dependent zinc metalloprotease FtsH [Nitrospirales bacterium]